VAVGQSQLADLSTLLSPNKPIRLKVEKAARKLHLIQNNQIIRTYDCVLGFDPIPDKLCEGDGRTPEGIFNIQAKYPHKSWQKFLWLDYPTAESYRKHQIAKKAKLIPADATVGSAIGIHGVPPPGDELIDQKIDWTLGCISVKTYAIEELYRFVSIGTKVEIVP
jgi:murein L,D-transpeptidase YafK